ncbi:MAG: alpha/beta hydrolase [Alphaproteobacteria bacterium]|nr:alpha/beta hydrolase [Alphaproteobacteria bacterium]
MDGLSTFRAQRVPAGDAEIFALIGGNGPPLLLLHGFPQTHICWSRLAPQLAERFTVVLADLTGYGASTGPKPEEDGTNYSKRAVAEHMVELMATLGHDRFSIAGHDRGARVAYRLALDRPECVLRLAALSILPTFAMWRKLGDVEKAIETYHWFLLAQKHPIPHDLLLGAPAKLVRNTIRSWTKSQTLDAFPSDELAAYESAFAKPEVVNAVCAEYRAGWTTDRMHDEADVAAKRKIRCPLLLLWGLSEYSEDEMRATWCEIADDITANGLDCGHFVVEEAPERSLAKLITFFS